jgi:plasmid stabilization system protein ParE
MVHKIVWSALAIKTYVSNIEYLEREWSEREIKQFIHAVQRKLLLLSLQPRSGAITNNRKNLRKSILNKRIILIYRHKPLKKEIELVRFFNTYQQPLKS